jgi:hypothetical protein
MCIAGSQPHAPRDAEASAILYNRDTDKAFFVLGTKIVRQISLGYCIGVLYEVWV